MKLDVFEICGLAVLPENAVAVATAEACLVVDRLVGDDLLHFIGSFPALDADILHQSGRRSLPTPVNTQRSPYRDSSTNRVEFTF